MIAREYTPIVATIHDWQYTSACCIDTYALRSFNWAGSCVTPATVLPVQSSFIPPPTFHGLLSLEGGVVHTCVSELALTHFAIPIPWVEEGSINNALSSSVLLPQKQSLCLGGGGEEKQQQDFLKKTSPGHHHMENHHSKATDRCARLLAHHYSSSEGDVCE